MLCRSIIVFASGRRSASPTIDCAISDEMPVIDDGRAHQLAPPRMPAAGDSRPRVDDRHAGHVDDDTFRAVIADRHEQVSISWRARAESISPTSGRSAVGRGSAARAPKLADRRLLLRDDVLLRREIRLAEVAHRDVDPRFMPSATRRRARRILLASSTSRRRIVSR